MKGSSIFYWGSNIEKALFGVLYKFGNFKIRFLYLNPEVYKNASLL